MRRCPRGAAGVRRRASARSGWSRPPRSISTGGTYTSRSSRRQRSVTRVRRSGLFDIEPGTIPSAPDPFRRAPSVASRLRQAHSPRQTSSNGLALQSGRRRLTRRGWRTEGWISTFAAYLALARWMDVEPTGAQPPTYGPTLGRALETSVAGRFTAGTLTLGTEICTGVLGTEIVTGGVGGISTGDSVGWMGRVGCGGWTPTGGVVGGAGTGVVGFDGRDPGPPGFCAPPCDSGAGPGSSYRPGARVCIDVRAGAFGIGKVDPPCGFSCLPTGVVRFEAVRFAGQSWFVCSNGRRTATNRATVCVASCRRSTLP